MIFVYWPNDFKKEHGFIIGPTSPFKGVCDHCKQRKIVRNYAYNIFERLGTLCKCCFNEINDELNYCLDFHVIDF